MRITLPSGTPAELAVPSSVEVSAGLVLIPDIGGLRPLFDEMCARFAEQYGWVVCAPEPFPGQETMELPERMAAMAGRTDERVLGDVDAAADVVRERGAKRVNVIGFCQGGMYTFKAAGTGRYDRGVAFYGMIRIPEQWRGDGQADPLDFLQREGAAAVLAVLGGQDQWTPPEDIEALRELPNVEMAVYPEADHAFAHDPSRPSYRAEDAADAWRRAIDFLQAPPA